MTSIPADNESQNNRPPEEFLLSSLADTSVMQGLEDGQFSDADNLERVAGFSVGIASLYVQEALGYPFIVIRRQCQVNHGALRYHIVPFTLFNVIAKINKRQTVSVFWKGWGSSCIVKGVAIITEIGICETLHIKRKGPSIKAEVLQKLLKGVTLLLTMPLISASLVDTIQTHALGQTRTMLTFFKDAFDRVAGRYVSRGFGRLLPLSTLIVPSSMYGVLRYSIHALLSTIITKVLSNRKNQFDDDRKQLWMRQSYYNELVSSLLSSFFTDVLLFPLETIVMRLHVQGTRTIIDDLDKGFGVTPLCTNYDGVTDCAITIHREEGYGGFFKGFGALVLQYVVQTVIIKIAKSIYFSLPVGKNQKNM